MSFSNSQNRKAVLVRLLFVSILISSIDSVFAVEDAKSTMPVSRRGHFTGHTV